MSKSIYEDVLKIIDKNIFELPEGFGILYEIRKKIQQAQKQEKLLELYKRLFNVCKEYKYTSIGLSDDSEFLNVMSELEEELK